MNYTKGQWKAYLTKKPDEWTVCAGENGIYGICETVFDDALLLSEKKANAHLISAAPDMYEALKSLKIRFDLAILDLKESQSDIEVCSKVDKALAKAEGIQ